MTTLDLAAARLPPTARIPLSAVIAQRLVEGELELPMLPETAAQVAKFAGDPGTDARRLVESVRRDATLVANLMRVANTSLYAARVPLTTLQQAVSRLGFVQVRQLALALACQARLFKSARYDDEVRACFRHSFATAWYAELVARRRRAPAEEAFLLGLLHDVGKPVLLQEITDLEDRENGRFDACTVTSVVEAHHAQVGAMVLRKWALPVSLIEAAERHHEVPDRRAVLAHVLRFSEALADHALGSGQDPQLVHAHDSLETLSLYAEEVEELIEAGKTLKDFVEALP